MAFVKSGIKAASKGRGRPKGSKKGRKPIPQNIKDKAKKAGFTSVKKWKEAGSPEPVEKPKKKKGSGPKRTRREEGELAALIRTQQRDAAEVAGNPRRRVVSGVPEGPNSPALSQVIPPKMSAAQRRARIAQGLVGGPRAARPGRKGEQVRDIGEYAPPRQQVADAMGLTGRGEMPTLEDFIEMEGFQITKKGGQIKGKSKKKSSNKYRGWGAARKPKGGK